MTTSPTTTPTPKRALITSVAGQDGSYLAEFLLATGYEVHGIKRRASLLSTRRVDYLDEDPHVEQSLEAPGYTADVDALGTLSHATPVQRGAR